MCGDKGLSGISLYLHLNFAVKIFTALKKIKVLKKKRMEPQQGKQELSQEPQTPRRVEDTESERDRAALNTPLQTQHLATGSARHDLHLLRTQSNLIQCCPQRVWSLSVW